MQLKREYKLLGGDPLIRAATLMKAPLLEIEIALN
jgi:hypothetical protein